MSLAVFGANGPTGRLLTKQAVAEGHAVTAVTRHPEAFPLRDARLRVLHGGVFDRSSVEEAVAGQDAVLSTLGVPYSRKPTTLYSQGTAHIVWAMNATAFGASSVSAPAGPIRILAWEDSSSGRSCSHALSVSLGRTLYADLKRME